MDEENQINDELKIKTKLTNARVKKYRKKKCTESQQLNYLISLPRKCKTIKLKKIMPNEREQWQRNVQEGFAEETTFFVRSWSHRLRPKKLHASVAVPAAPVRVPSQRLYVNIGLLIYAIIASVTR